MNIQGVIKFYFSFTLILVCAAGLSYNHDVRELMVNSFNIDLSAEKNLLTTVSSNKGLLSEKLATGKNEQGLFAAVNTNSNIVSFEMVSTPDKSYASPGASNVEIMKFAITAYETPVSFNEIKLKTFGIDSKYVTRASMILDEENSVEGILDGGYFVFKNISYNLAANNSGYISLRVDLSDEVTTGNRLRMDIEKPDDIELFVGGGAYKLNAYYPIEGRYLSITRPNPKITKLAVE